MHIAWFCPKSVNRNILSRLLCRLFSFMINSLLMVCYFFCGFHSGCRIQMSIQWATTGNYDSMTYETSYAPNSSHCRVCMSVRIFGFQFVFIFKILHLLNGVHFRSILHGSSIIRFKRKGVWTHTLAPNSPRSWLVTNWPYTNISMYFVVTPMDDNVEVKIWQFLHTLTRPIDLQRLTDYFGSILNLIWQSEYDAFWLHKAE